MNLLKDIRENNLNAKRLSRISLGAIRVTIEACDCPKNNLCDICKNLLTFYKWKKERDKEKINNAVDWVMDQCCLIFYGPKYKEQNMHFSRDLYTLKQIVELYEEYLISKEKE